MIEVALCPNHKHGLIENGCFDHWLSFPLTIRLFHLFRNTTLPIHWFCQGKRIGRGCLASHLYFTSSIVCVSEGNFQLFCVWLQILSYLTVINFLAVKDAFAPLGLGDGKILNSSLQASSTLNRFHKPGYGRLNTVIDGGAWCARDTNRSHYFQVDLHEIHKITEIVLQGKYSGSSQEQGWVIAFSVTYSIDGIVWSQHIKDGLSVGSTSLWRSLKTNNTNKKNRLA